MELRCDEVRSLMASRGNLPEEQAERVAVHLDGCPDCEQELRRVVASALGSIPVPAGPSLSAVRELARKEQRRSMFFRVAGLAAAALMVAATGWAMLRNESAPQQARKPHPSLEERTEIPPEPPKVADLQELDRATVRSEGALALYLQFCLTCINDPTEQDKQEYLTRSLLIFREVRGRLRTALERKPAPAVEEATLDALNDALGMVQTSKLPSVNFLPSKVTAFRTLPAGELQFNHELGKKNWRLTIQPMPEYLNFAYLKIALGANGPLMSRVEDALWATFAALPKRIEEKDPTIAPKALDTVLPLLSPRQQAVYRKIVGAP